MKQFILSATLLLRISGQFQTDMAQFPWVGKYEDRNKEILLNLKRNMNLEVYKESIPKALLSSNIYMKDGDGRNISISLHGEDLTSNYKSFSTITDINDLNGRLNSSCSLHLGPYWSYEWCYGRSVQQFHLHQETVMEQMGQDGVRRRFVDNSQAGLRDPNWSLGIFYNQEFKRYGSNQDDTSAPIESVIQYFRDGQYCDETGMGRWTSVHLQCCNIPEAKTGPINPLALLLLNIEEVELCTYKMSACSPLLCQAEQVDQTLVDITTQLSRSPCLTRQEEWWTYEVCFNRSVIQFHAKLVPVVQDESKVNLQHVVESKFELGFPPHQLFENETALRERISRQDTWVDSFEQTNGDSEPLAMFFALARATGVASGTLPGRSLLLEYTGGSPCDLLPNKNRSSTVEVSCGVRDLIADITEDHTCHYYVKVTSRILCTSSLFAPKARQASRVQFTQVTKQTPLS